MNASTVSHLALSLVAPAVIAVACAVDTASTAEQDAATDSATAQPHVEEAAAVIEDDPPLEGPLTPAWRTVTQSELNEDQQAAHRRAVSARTTLGAQLIGILSESMAAFGPEHTVEVCSELAPKFAEDVGHRYRVAVGRTSLRTRNAKNLPPAWAHDVVQANEGVEHIMLGPDDRVGVLTPIFTGELCTRCHGPADGLDASVIAAIQRSYPLDQATGFRTGDLRGWFWVDAPLITPPPVFAESHPSDPNAREALHDLPAPAPADGDTTDGDTDKADAPTDAEDAPR